jgi:hypothetical protein
MRAILRPDRFGFLLAIAMVLPPGLVAQQHADSADVSSVDGIVAALYDVISGPAGQKRDWNRWNTLFIDGARLISVGVGREGGAVRYRVLTPAEYVELSGPYLEQNGFFEREVHRETQQFGQIAHLFSTYESRRDAPSPQPVQRGINSIQLINDGSRWWIATVMWDSERPGNPIPDRYLAGR